MLIQRSAWKGNSPKSVCARPHSPARWPPYGWPETSRLLKGRPLHVARAHNDALGRMRGTRREADVGVGGSRSLRGRSITGGPAVQRSMCPQAGCTASPLEAALRPSWDGSSATAAIEAPFRDSKRVARDRHKNKGPFGAMTRGVSTLGDAPRNRFLPPGTPDRPGRPSIEGGLALI